MQLAQHIATHAANLAAASAADATNTANNAYIDVSKSDSNAVGPLIAAADALLSHLKGQWTGFGPDKALWNALGKVKFVPATLGLPGAERSANQRCLWRKTDSSRSPVCCVHGWFSWSYLSIPVAKELPSAGSWQMCLSSAVVRAQCWRLSGQFCCRDESLQSPVCCNTSQSCDHTCWCMQC